MNESPSSDWKHNANIYEVNLRQYTEEGTFRAFQKELPRLKNMGVKTLWFMPITPISEKNKKGSLGSYYAAHDYTAINSEFGNLEDFKALVKEAHQQGFKVIIDWVANHTGWDHVWTKEHPDFYEKNPDGTFRIAEGMDDIIELDYNNPEMRKAMIDAMKYWINEADIDGFRCDLAAWVPADFWEQARPELEKIKPLFFIGEFDELENPEYGKTFDASYSWEWMHKTEDFYKNNLPLSELRNLLKRYDSIPGPSMRAWFTSNHDENTWNGTEYEKYGNMAFPLAVFSFTYPGIPLVYNAQELPLRTKRLNFFEKDPIPWNGKHELSEFYKKLMNLKSENPALRGSDENALNYEISTTAPNEVLSYLRKNGNDEVLVLLNLSKNDSLQFTINDERVQGKFKGLFSDEERDFSQNKSFRMQAYDYLVLIK